MNELAVLIDLANTMVFRGVHRPNRDIVGARLDRVLHPVAETVAVRVPTPVDNIRFRLYDGWFDEDGYGTELHGLVRAHLRNYPTKLRSYRLFVSIAEGPAALPSGRLVHTYRKEKGFCRYPVNLRPERPEACASPSSCPLRVLHGWFQGGCPLEAGCEVTAEDIATYDHQKLVDSTLVADAVWYAAQGFGVAVLSEDEDVIPGLLTARAFGNFVAWLCRSGRARTPYDQIIATSGVECLAC